MKTHKINKFNQKILSSKPKKNKNKKFFKTYQI